MLFTFFYLQIIIIYSYATNKSSLGLSKPFRKWSENKLCPSKFISNSIYYACVGNFILKPYRVNIGSKIGTAADQRVFGIGRLSAIITHPILEQCPPCTTCIQYDVLQFKSYYYKFSSSLILTNVKFAGSPAHRRRIHTHDSARRTNRLVSSSSPSHIHPRYIPTFFL